MHGFIGDLPQRVGTAQAARGEELRIAESARRGAVIAELGAHGIAHEGGVVKI